MTATTIVETPIILAGVIACCVALAVMWVAAIREKRRRAKWEFDKDGIPF